MITVIVILVTSVIATVGVPLLRWKTNNQQSGYVAEADDDREASANRSKGKAAEHNEKRKDNGRSTHALSRMQFCDYADVSCALVFYEATDLPARICEQLFHLFLGHDHVLDPFSNGFLKPHSDP